MTHWQPYPWVSATGLNHVSHGKEFGFIINEIGILWKRRKKDGRKGQVMCEGIMKKGGVNSV